jgi:TPR repeat protein
MRKLLHILFLTIVVSCLSFGQSTNDRIAFARDLMIQYLETAMPATVADYDKAARLIETDLRENPTDTRQLNNLKAQSLFFKSMADVQRFRENKWDLPIPEQKEQLRENTIEIQKAVSQYPESGFLYLPLGLSLQELGFAGRAEETFKKGVKSAGFVANHLLLGDYYMSRENMTLALQNYRMARIVSAENPYALQRITQVYVKRNQADSALYMLERETQSLLSASTNKGIEAIREQLKKKHDASVLYYCMGLLYEKGMNTSQNFNTANKWYTYASQMGLSAASEKLNRLIKAKSIIATSADVERIQKNTSSDVVRFLIPALFSDGSTRKVSIFVQNFPPNNTQPVAHEIARIQEVCDATVSAKIVQAFDGVYALWQRNPSRTYQEMCKAALDFSGEEENIVASTSNKPTVTSQPPSSTSASSVPQASTPQASADVAIKPVVITGTDFEQLAIGLGESNIDSANYYMSKAAVLQWGVDLSNVKESKKILEQRLKTAGALEGRYLYAVGYLLENAINDDDKDLIAAKKWYLYAFQQGYKPALPKLSQLYKTISQSKVKWLQDNAKRGLMKIEVPVRATNGSTQKQEVNLMEFPFDSSNPLSVESERLNLVYGSSIPQPVIDSFGQLSALAVSNGQSFRGLVRRVLDLHSSKSAPQTDIESKAMQAMSEYLKML